jgi:hypothetical protein
MLYQLSYASPSGVRAPGANRPGHPEKPSGKLKNHAHTLSLRMFFGTEPKISIGFGTEQTCGKPWKSAGCGRLASGTQT